MIYIQLYFIGSIIYTIIAGVLNYRLQNPEHWAGVLITGTFFWPVPLITNLNKMKDLYVRKLKKEKGRRINDPEF